LTDRSVFARKTFLSAAATQPRVTRSLPAADRPRLRQNGKRALNERRLLIRYREHGDLAARDELTRLLMPLARQLAFRYRHKGEPVEDLVQVANLALVKAIDGFDPGRGTALSTYAVPTILGELRRYFRDASWSVHVGRHLQERTMLIERVSVRLGSRLGRSPSVAELAAETDLSEEEICEALEASHAYRATSLDEQLYDDDGGTALVDTLGSEDDGYELVDDRSAALSAMRTLDDRARQILEMRFGADMTQSQIAAELGLSQMHVSRLLRRALAQLRETAAAEIAA
jgi:RNA polymerase sigma-B factor